MPDQVLADKSRNKVVTVIVPLLHAQCYRDISPCTNRLKLLWMQLFCEKFIPAALVDQQGDRLGTRRNQAGGIPGLPLFPVSTEIGAETTLAPATGDRVANRGEGRN